MFTIRGKEILLSLATALLIHTVKTTFHELMETTHGLTIAFGNKGCVGLSSNALWCYWVGLIYRKHAVSFKSTPTGADTTLEPQWHFDANHFSLVAYHRITAVIKLHLHRRVCIQGAAIPRATSGHTQISVWAAKSPKKRRKKRNHYESSPTQHSKGVKQFNWHSNV